MTNELGSTWKRYVHQDHLSNRVITDEAGAAVYQQGHFPFVYPERAAARRRGELWYQSGGNTPWKFTRSTRPASETRSPRQARGLRCAATGQATYWRD